MRITLSYIIAFLLFVVTVSGLKAQNWNSFSAPVVSGVLKGVDDFEKTPYPLAGANVKVTCLGDTTQVFNGVTEKTGYFWVTIATEKKLKDQRVRVQFSYVGMEPVDTIVEPKAIYNSNFGTYSRPIADFGELVMTAKPVTTEEAVIIGELKKMYESGDTVVFNTEAYEMPTGSVLLELVRRLPGLVYDNGKLTYLGRSIDEIRMNGDTFFKHDINIALKNMPNDKLKKLKIYEAADDTLNVKSDKHLVMDMQTDKPYTKTVFCNAGAATNEKLDGYAVDGDVNSYLKGNSTISLRARLDELLTSFVSADKRTMATVNGDASWKRKWGDIDFRPDYLYDRMERRSEELTQMFMPDYTQYSVAKSFNRSTRKDGGGSFSFNGSAGKHLYWSLNGNIKVQEDRDDSGGERQMYSGNPFLGEGHDAFLDEEQLKALKLNDSKNSSRRLTKDKNTNWSGRLARRFGEGKSDLTFTFGVKYSDRESTVHDVTETRYFRFEDSLSLYNRMTSTPEDRIGLNAGLDFSKSFGKDNYWSVAYALNYDEAKRKERYYDVIDVPEDAALLDADGMAGLSLVDSLSYTNRDKTLKNILSAALKMCWGGLEMKASFGVSPTRLSVYTNRAGGQVSDTTYSATLLAPSFSLLYKKGTKNVSLAYSGSGEMPSGRNVLTVTDYSDPLNLYTGNANLRNAFRHTLTFRAGNMKTRLESVLSMRDNEVRMRSVYDAETGVRRTFPDNVNGNWGVNTSLNRSFNFFNQSQSLKVSHTYSHEVGYVQRLGSMESVKGITQAHTVNLSASTYYYSKKLRGMVNVSYAMNFRDNDYLSSSMNTRLFHLDLSPTYCITDFLSLSTSMSWYLYGGYEMKSANRNDVYLDAKLEYKFLRSRMATLSFEYKDILRVNNDFDTSVTDTQWSETRRFGNMSYAVIRFEYRFNMMK